MKKIFTFISLQKGTDLEETVYESMGNTQLQTDFPIHFPVIAMINGYVEAGETVRLFVIGDNANREYESNLEVLKQDLDRVKEKKDFTCEIVPIRVSEKELATDHLKTYSEMLNRISDGDDLYVCITYGTKPTPIIEMMVLQTAYSLKNDVTVGCVVYGKFDHWKKEGKIYDITALFHMTQIVTELNGRRIDHPEDFIKGMLDLEEEK